MSVCTIQIVHFQYLRSFNKFIISYHIEVECFPSDATVDVLNQGPVSLSTLTIGSQVRVVNEQQQISYSPIIAFLHRDVNQHAMYRRIRTQSAQIELSKRHLIQHRQNGFVWSEQLKVGDEILVAPNSDKNITQWESILTIQEVEKQGLMAPLTEQGTILVNNVHASCYALANSHDVAHWALAPYRLYHRLFGSVETKTSQPILSYANVLLQFFKNIPIAKDLIF